MNFISHSDCNEDELSIPDAMVVLERNSTDLIAEYTCEHGYNLVGNDKRFCTFNNIWTGTLPSCKGNQINALYNYKGFFSRIIPSLCLVFMGLLF